MQEQILVGLVEDQLLFREGLKGILQSASSGEFKVIFEAGDGFSVIEKLQNAHQVPNVMVVDISLPPGPDQKVFSGLDLTGALTDAYPEIKILILSVHEDENFIAEIIEHGAHGYLVKDSNPQEVFEAIRSVHLNGSYINERALKAIQSRLGKKNKPNRINIKITHREEEILQLVCQQFTAEEIAKRLFISVKTVNGHRNNLLQKTGSKNATGLVLYAVKNNIITLV
jgi:two-component system response regulator NreC